MNRISAVIIFVFFYNLTFAQQVQDSLYSSGEIPDYILVRSSVKFYNDQKNNNINQTRNERISIKNFYLTSNYSIDNLLTSGDVWINDIIGKYVSKVLDTLLFNDKKLRSELNVFIFRAPEVNAFATDQGVICVNLGLFTRLHNEAELAFILSHEIEHYVRKHALSQIQENFKIEQDLFKYDKISEDELYLKKHGYSRSLESEADQKGLLLYKAAGYSIKDLSGVFDVLRNADHPYEDLPFPVSFFETPYFKFPAKLTVDHIPPIIFSTDSTDDKYSTHPSVEKRRKAIFDLCDTTKADPGKSFLVSEILFNRIKCLAQNEESKLYMVQHEYLPAIYHLYLLIRNGNDNEETQVLMSKCLYNNAVTYNHDFEKHDADFSKVTGNAYQLYSLMRNLSKKEKNVLSFIYAWKLKDKYPQNAEIPLLIKYSLTELIRFHNLELDDHNNIFSAKGARKDFADSALSYLSGDTAFVRYYQLALKNSEYFKTSASHNDKKSSGDDDTFFYNKEYSLPPADSILVVNPFYYKFDFRNSGSSVTTDYIGSEVAKDNLIKSIIKSREKLKMNITLLDVKNFTKQDGDKFNDMSILNQWVNERGMSADYDFIPTEYKEIKGIEDKYNSRYVLLTGCFFTKRSNQYNSAIYYFLVAASQVFIPQLGYTVFSPRYDFFQLSVLYDTHTGKILWRNVNHIPKTKDVDSFVSMQQFDVLKSFKYPDKVSK